MNVANHTSTYYVVTMLKTRFANDKSILWMNVEEVYSIKESLHTLYNEPEARL